MFGAAPASSPAAASMAARPIAIENTQRVFVCLINMRVRLVLNPKRPHLETGV